MEVTKVDLKKELTEKDFRIPKDFDVKPPVLSVATPEKFFSTI